VVADVAACQAFCDGATGCAFYTFHSPTNTCSVKYSDLVANTGTVFKGQTSGYMLGEIRWANVINTTPIIVNSYSDCSAACKITDLCQFVIFDQSNAGAVQCWMKYFDADPATTIGFRLNPRELNYNPTELGRIDVIGNSGVVCIAASLLPDGRLSCVARPEYQRGGPNPDNIMAPFVEANGRYHNVPYGEIGSIFDPISGTHQPSPVVDNIFCHAAVLDADGTLFTAGGDGDGQLEGPAGGLLSGLNTQRSFDYRTNQWTYGQEMRMTRWYPSAVRLVNGSFIIIGGLTSGTSYLPQKNLEFYNPGVPVNTLLPSPILDFTGTAGYPKPVLIPGSGHVFLFAYQSYAVISKVDGTELEREQWTPNGDNLVKGRRSGDYIGGNCLLPMHASRGYKAVFALFGGGEVDPYNQTARNDVAMITITDPAPKKWYYETDLMPYGRVVSDCTLQPNGKMLITNGARLGYTGGNIGLPNMFAAANDIFQYDPEAPVGSKFKVLAASSIRRFYHSVTVLAADGRTLIAGTDEATYTPATSYEHRVEAFTPPWLLNGTPRPVILSVPNGPIAYAATFEVTFTGTVTGVSIMTPNSGTHGTEMTQRMIFPTFTLNDGFISVVAPPDPTVMLQGWHMLFLLNGDTPSVAKWIQFL